MVVACIAAPALAGTIDDELQAALAETPADQPITGLVYMADRVDIDALEADFTRMNASMHFRHEKTVTELQETATRAQADLLAYLNERSATGTVESYKTFWIANAISVTALPEEIRTIADRDDVLIVYFNYEIENIKPVNVPEVRGAGDGPVQMGDITTGVVAVRAPEAWDMGFDGTGVLVSTLDTGVDGNHPALASRWRGLDPEYDGHGDWAFFDPVTNRTFPFDAGSHGTHTMGSVCGGPPGEHVGVAPGAQWIQAAVIDRVSIPRTVSDALLAYEWLIDPDGNPNTNWDVPAVNSNSWGVTTGHGYPPCDETFWDHIDACEAAGIVVVYSAGNEGSSGLRRPADRATNDYDSLAVASVNANIQGWPISGFSSRGPTNCTPGGGPAIKPDISAPGENVRSCVPGGGYGNNSGTSMASPHVNGVIALMRQANPELPVDEIKQIIYDTAFDLGPDGEDNAYGWGMIDAFEAVQIALSRRTIRFEYPSGRPDLIDPNGGSRMRVEVTGSDNAQPEPGTGMLHYFADGEWVEVAMEQVEDNIYDAVFPAVPCMDDLMYYLSAETTDNELVTDPFGAPDRTYSATGLLGYDDYFADDFQTDQGWSVVNENVTGGAWERGVPFGAGDPAPDADFDGSGSCYVTGNRVFDDVDGGPTRLITPRIDLAGRLTTISFARYFVSGSTDRMQVEVSNDDGGTWTIVEDNEPDPSGWVEASFVVDDYVAPTANVRIRFSVADEPNNSFCEAGVDAFLIVETLCGGGGGCVREPAWQCDGDVDGDAQVNPVDAGLVQAAFGSTDGQDLCNYDLDCDGQINPVDSGIVQALFGTCEPVRQVCP
jgi:bacillopeptidase F